MRPFADSPSGWVSAVIPVATSASSPIFLCIKVASTLLLPLLIQTNEFNLHETTTLLITYKIMFKKIVPAVVSARILSAGVPRTTAPLLHSAARVSTPLVSRRNYHEKDMLFHPSIVESLWRNMGFGQWCADIDIDCPLLDHYNNPRNVGSMDKKDLDVGTGLVGAPACEPFSKPLKNPCIVI